jgi:hypothetical protein
LLRQIYRNQVTKKPPILSAAGACCGSENRPAVLSSSPIFGTRAWLGAAAIAASASLLQPMNRTLHANVYNGNNHAPKGGSTASQIALPSSRRHWA